MRNSYRNIVALIIVLIAAAIFTRFRDSKVRDPEVADAPIPPYSCWGIQPGMSLATIKSNLGIEFEPGPKGLYYYCEGCSPQDWSQDFCLEHSSLDQNVPAAKAGMISLHKDRVVSMSVPTLAFEGKVILSVGDTLERAQAALPQARTVKYDDWSSNLALPQKEVMVDCHGGEVSSIHINTAVPVR